MASRVRAVRKWRQTPPIERLSPAALYDLVDYAIGVPGVTLERPHEALGMKCPAGVYVGVLERT